MAELVVAAISVMVAGKPQGLKQSPDVAYKRKAGLQPEAPARACLVAQPIIKCSRGTYYMHPNAPLYNLLPCESKPQGLCIHVHIFAFVPHILLFFVLYTTLLPSVAASASFPGEENMVNMLSATAHAYQSSMSCTSSACCALHALILCYKATVLLFVLIIFFFN